MSGRQRVRLAMYQARAGLPADAADGCGNCCITRLLVALWGAIQACASLCCRREPRAPFSAPVPVRQGAGGLGSRSASPSPSQLSRQPDPFETRVSPRHRVTEGTPLERTMLFGFDDQSSLKSIKAEESRPPECPICLEDFVGDPPLELSACQHQYHLHCLASWLERPGSYPRPRSCPVCGSEMHSPELDDLL